MIKYAAKHSLGRWVAPFAVAAILGLSYFRSDIDWRFEMARASDAAGLYLLLLLPVWAGVAAWDAQQLKTRLASFLPVVPSPGRALFLSYLGTAVWALGFHVLVVVAHMGTALASGALGGPLLALIAVQFAVTAGFVAFGAILGWQFPSPLIGPGVAAGVFAFSTFGVTFNSRNLTDVGIGGSYFYGQKPDVIHLGFQAGTGLALVATVVLVAAVLRSQLKRTLVVGGAVAAVLAFVTVAVIQPKVKATAASASRNCETQGGVSVCVPDEFSGSLPEIVSQSGSVAQTISDLGGTPPADAVLDVATGSSQPGVAIVELTPADIRSGEVVDDALIAAYTHPFSCDLAGAPTDLEVAVFDTIYALVHAERGTSPLSGYAEDLVAAVSGLSDSDREAWFARTTAQMWSCQTSEIRLPTQIEAPAWLPQPDE